MRRAVGAAQDLEFRLRGRGIQQRGGRSYEAVQGNAAGISSASCSHLCLKLIWDAAVEGQAMLILVSGGWDQCEHTGFNEIQMNSELVLCSRCLRGTRAFILLFGCERRRRGAGGRGRATGERRYWAGSEGRAQGQWGGCEKIRVVPVLVKELQGVVRLQQPHSGSVGWELQPDQVIVVVPPGPHRGPQVGRW